MRIAQLARSLACPVGVALVLILVPAAPARSQQRPAPASAAPASALKGTVGETQTGLAAYYNSRLNGRRTASGERYNQEAMTTARRCRSARASK